MAGLEIIESFVRSGASRNDRIIMTEVAPSDYAGITMVYCDWLKCSPAITSFVVPSQRVVIAVRLEGDSIITSKRLGSNQLIVEGSVGMFVDGGYNALFGKGSSKTLFAFCDKTAVPALDVVLKAHSGGPPRTRIDLRRDPLMAKVNAILEPESKHSYFKFSAVLAELLDRLAEPTDSMEARYGIPPQDPSFYAVCQQVVANPGANWTSVSGAEASGYSQYHFSRTFKQKVGTGFHEFVNRVRVIQALENICEAGEVSASNLAELGFDSPAVANKHFQRECGFGVGNIGKILIPKRVALAS